MFAEVAVAVGNRRDCIYTYHTQQQIMEGMRVLVPLGAKTVRGYVVRCREDALAGTYKEIRQILDDVPIFSQELLATAEFVSKQYLCPLYYVLEHMLPAWERTAPETQWQWVEGAQESCLALLDEKTLEVARYIQEKPRTAAELEKRFGDTVEYPCDLLEQRGIIEKKLVMPKEKQAKTEYCYVSLVEREELEAVTEQKLKRASQQAALLRYLVFEGPQTGKKLRQYWPNHLALAAALCSKGLVEKRAVDKLADRYAQSAFVKQAVFTLNAQQQYAVEQVKQAIEEDKHKVFLLEGVTGSGKTEVYLQLMKTTLHRGKSVLFLVPEISLTPQLIGRLQSALEEKIEVLHSNLSDGERWQSYKRLRSGESKVALGVRSAVFAPLQDLGLIVIDEAHETTFKQSEPDPRYQAKEVAIFRARYGQIPLVMGSATPAVADYDQAMRGNYQLLRMTQRINQKPMPKMDLIDMAQEFRTGNRSMFSQALAKQIEDSLRKKEQVILLINRRGYASSVICRECGTVLQCPQCSIAMTYHQDKNMLKCHYCEHVAEVPHTCPKCGSRFIRYMGSGTEQLEAEVNRRWPWVKTLRMDLDTTQEANAHQRILEQFASGEAQILIGTQMVAKGLDFPDVTTVGILAADQFLNLPDYAAAERSFQLITQAAGRAGRGEKEGRVIVQTYNPQHYSLLAAAAYDYRAFYEKEIRNRQLLGYPPFQNLARVLFSDFDERRASLAAQEAAAYLKREQIPIAVLGPAQAPIEQIRKRWRYHLILQSESKELLLQAAQLAKDGKYLSRKSNTLRILVDIDPQSIL